MKIGIVGAGNIGGTLTRLLTARGHTVSVANSRGPETLAAFAAETGAVPVPLAVLGHGVEVVIVAIPFKNVADLPAGLFDDGTVVVETGNYAPRQRDGKIDEIEQGMAESRWVEARLGHPVIKAFNNIRPQPLLTLGRAAGAPDRVALPVAGDDNAAKAVVLDLVGQLGFDGVDAGGLDESWRQQPGTPVYCTDLDVEGVRKGLVAASPERLAAWSA